MLVSYHLCSLVVLPGELTCPAAYIYVRGEFVYEINNLQRAIDEAYEGTWLASVLGDVY